jgi:hypothetical protein
LKEFKSVQKWFRSKPYKETTKAIYLQYLSIICGLTSKNPDELAKVDSKEALGIQIQLAITMEQELKLKTRSISQRINVVHSFWRSNGVLLTDSIMRYEGTPSLQRVVKAPKNHKFFRKDKAQRQKKNCQSN